ncbi:MAG: hypothetical protein K2W80_03175, partial [Burkholderiales bacterium]|nr:hypothetical protein [Burkholderiales bacterium]
DRAADRPRSGEPMRERSRPSDRGPDRAAGSSARRRMADDPLFTTAYVPPPLPEATVHGAGPTVGASAEAPAVARRRRFPVPALLSAPPESA